MLDLNGKMESLYNSELANTLTVEANLDQTGRAFMKDLVLSMFDEGVVAAVPVETTFNPTNHAFDVTSIRTGKIIRWMPEHVCVRVYNERTGKKEDLVLPKRMVAIIENPFYEVMNEPNSIAQRLIRKFSLLDVVDEHTASNKLDMIVEFPHTIRSEAREQEALKRINDIQEQLKNSKYGIAYIDGTEKVTQLNRPLENNLLSQIQYLTTMLYAQLGITESIMNGTANEQEMINYNAHTIEPIITAITEEFTRKFLSKNARTRGQAIRFVKDPFRLAPATAISNIAGGYVDRAILTPNEVRSIIGYIPSPDPHADALFNRNINPNNQIYNANGPNYGGQYGGQQPEEPEQPDYGMEQPGLPEGTEQ